MGNAVFVHDGEFCATVLSPNRVYRYKLYRPLGLSFFGRQRPCAFVMLNPSTADENHDDATIRRCMAYATAWGASEIFVVNLFAIRAREPAVIQAIEDPEGPDNHTHVCQVARYVARVGGLLVCAWGAEGGYLDQDRRVLGWIRQEGAEPLALRVTAEGFPGHPLYLPAALEPRPYAGREAEDQEEGSSHVV